MVESSAPRPLMGASCVPEGPWRDSSARAPESSGDSPAMYAIVNINGIQTRVEPEAVIQVARLTGEPGARLTFDQVLLVADGDSIAVGQPYVQGASLTAEVVEHFRGPKIRIFRYKRRQDYRKRRGYRDDLTRLRVTGIQR